MGSEVIILPALFGSVVWLVYVIVDGFRRRQRLRVFTEFHGKLLDRIGNAREFGEFFGSEAGERFLESMASEKGAPHARILAAVQWGFTLTVLGLALFVLVGNYDFERFTADRFKRETVDVIVFVATVAVGLGVGMLVSSLASYFLSKKMGLVSDRRDREA
jgi:hypothetical protein